MGMLLWQEGRGPCSWLAIRWRNKLVLAAYLTTDTPTHRAHQVARLVLESAGLAGPRAQRARTVAVQQAAQCDVCRPGLREIRAVGRKFAPAEIPRRALPAGLHAKEGEAAIRPTQAAWGLAPRVPAAVGVAVRGGPGPGSTAGRGSRHRVGVAVRVWLAGHTRLLADPAREPGWGSRRLQRHTAG